MAGDELKHPQKLPSSTHEVIVLLDGINFILDNVDTAPQSHELISYHYMVQTHEIRERVQQASIVIATQAPINGESLGEAPYLKFVIVPSVGTNHIDLEECRRRGIRVANSPGSTSLAVAEHCLSMYFAARRGTVTMHNVLRDVDENGKNIWKREGNASHKMKMANGNPPVALCQEVVGIFGYGFIGKRLATLCEALGMKVLISGRKTKPGGATTNTPAQNGNESTSSNGNSSVTRTPFDEVIRSATVLFITCPLTPETANMLDGPEFAAMRPEAVVINAGRGGVVNNVVLVQALRENRISGAAVDVYDREPASSVEDSVLLAEDARDLNLTLSPHVGYFSGQTVLMMDKMTRAHLKNYATGEEGHYVV
ncbi:glycerate dehydrogenase [Camillea tinctor]|nr:glycerate dehydrogenase [Camillea tinctor]